MSNGQTTLNLNKINLSEFNSLDVPMSAEDVLRGQKKTKLNSTMSQAIQTNPQQQAKVNELSRQSGIPTTAVEGDIPAVESHLKLKNIDLDSMVTSHPVTADYMSDYNNAAVAHDDIDNLQNLESTMNPAPEVEQPDYLPFNTLRGLGGRITDLLGSAASGISQISDAIEEEFPTGAFTIVGGVPMYIPPEQWDTLKQAGVAKDAIAEAGDALKSQDFGYIPRSTWESTKQSFSEDGNLSGVGEALSFGLEQGVVSLPDMAATVFALPAYILARSEEIGQERAVNKGLEQGTLAETIEAAPFAIGSAILEKILPERVIKGMSKTELESVGQQILEGATSKVKEVLARTTDGLIIEASTEAVQEGIIEYIGETYGTDKDIDIDEMIDRALGGAVGGGIAGAGIAGGIESVNINRQQIEEFYNRWATRKLDAAAKEQMRLSMKGIQEQKTIDAVNEYSTNSQLRELDPASFRQFVEQSDGDKDLSVFIDGVQAKLYVSQLGASNDPVVQMLNAKVNEAAALGSDVAIPIADFATLMAGTEHFDALREFMTMSGETTAPFRQEANKEEFDNYVKSLMTEAAESTREYVEAQNIYNSVREQLVDTGVVSPANATVMANLVPAWATVFAERNGIGVKEAYDRAGLTIEGPQTGEADRLAAELDTLSQSDDSPKNLVVTHNLSAENIIAAADLGGLAAPSIATVRSDISDFTEFGEVSLLADPSLLESDKARNFDADIYSPRQPRAVYDINNKAYYALDALLDPDGLGLSKPDIQSVSDISGADNLRRSAAVQYHWLTLQGKAPKIKTKKIPPAIKKADKLGTADILDVKFRKVAKEHYTSLVDAVRDQFPERAERLAGLYFMEDGEVNASSLRDFESQVRRFNREGNTDLHQLRGDIDKKLRTKKLRDEYDQWVTATFNGMVDSKKIFKGFTNAGNRKYLPYNMQNVVKEMTQKLQAGETSFYGAGSVRSAYANEMKTIEQVKARRDSIVTEEQMIEVKEDSANVLEDALAKLKPFYKFDADSWGYSEDAGNAIIEGRKGLNEAFDMTPEAYKIVSDLTEYLAGLPSSYFETKIQRPVAFGEFNTAVVPKGMDKQALQILKDAGLKIKTYDDVNKTRQQVIAEQQKLLFQNQGVTRGYYSPSESVIRLNEAADLSTFLHEFAHFMYEMELSNANNTPESVNVISSIHNWYKRNADDVVKEANTYADGVTVTTEQVTAYLDNGSTGDEQSDQSIRRAVHEQFARGFETYLMEGKAPSVELRNVFRTFARWLTEIYRSVRGNLNVTLDKEMRQVFDRMVATENQIAAAEARSQYAPMFTDAAMAGMTEEEFVKYSQAQSKMEDKQTETLRDKIIKQLTRQTEKRWKEELADEVDVQTESLKEEKVYRARETLKTGEVKLDHAATKELIGEDVTDKRGRTSHRIPPKFSGMTIKGAQGIHPDEAAALFGYGSGAEMLADMSEAAPIKERAEAQAELEMLNRHGDILHDGTIEKEADEALLNEERGALILQELKALNKGTKAPSIDRQALKSLAQESIGKLAYRNIHPEKYRKAEIRAAQESAAALQAGNREGAAAAKVRQAMNFYLHKEATEARNDTMKIVERMARYNKKTVQESIMRAENGYWEQIVKLLNRFEFRKAATLRGVDQRNENINSWAKERNEADGDALVLTPEVLDELYTTHWKNVPYDKLTGINDSVKNIEHVARYSNKMKAMGEEIDFKKLVSTWTTHMSSVNPSRFKSQRTDVAEGRNWGRMAMAQMTKIPFLASWLDGGERGGMSHDILVQPFTDAYSEEVKMWNESGKPVMDLIENRSKEDIKRHNTKVFIPELVDENNDGNLYGNQVVAVALNVGNAGNLRKMLLGEGWANPDDDSEININNPKLQAILKRMTKSDWDLVQTIWDRMELLYPQLAEVHHKTTGLTPPKVGASPVQTPYGVYKGGYYPVKYDPNRSIRAQDNEDKQNAQVDSMFSGNASIQASVNASSTSERTRYYAPIRLSLDVVPSHFQETIHFITHHDAVRQTNKLIRNPDVAKTIKESLGPEEYAQLRPWLNDIAKDGREATTKLWWEDIIGRLRFGVTLGAMGFKASTGIMQLLGVSNIAAEVGAKYTYQAAKEILGSPTDIQNAWDFASSNSKILSSRVVSMDREIKNAMSRINSQINIKSGNKVKDIFYRFDNSNVLKTVQEASMKHIAYIQTYMVDLPTWYAAYIKEMGQSGDEAKAYRVADWTVENIQGSGATKDLAAIMRTRNETTRMLTMFMTFFSSLWNLQRDLAKGAKSGQYSVTTVAAKLMFLLAVPTALEMFMRGELGDDEEEPEEQLQKFLMKTALYPVASVPFARDIITGSVGEFGYNISPVASLIEQGTNSIPELIRRPLTDEEITKGQVKGATKFAAAALGVPATGQIWATGEHLYEVLEEGEDFTGREFLFGPKRD